MLIVAVPGLPKVALEMLLKTTLNCSVDSLATSLLIATAKLFDDSPGPKVSVPDLAV
jgi:hypothetical protein